MSIEPLTSRLRIRSLEACLTLYHFQIRDYVRQLGEASNSENRWLIRIEIDMLQTKMQTLQLIVALLERKWREIAGLPSTLGLAALRFDLANSRTI